MAQNNIKRRKEDALELAYLLYDIFKESEEANEKTENQQDETK